jgi:DNA-binding NarL/FixJ family response regulator
MPLTVVIVDDDLDYRQIVRYLLASAADMTIVGEAADGEEALAIARHERPDLVITDLMMPRLDGVELTRRIRQDLPPTKVILMSSYTEDAYRLMASDSGADAFVSKQVLSTSLLPAIRDVIRRRFSGGSGPLLPFAVVLPAQYATRGLAVDGPRRPPGRRGLGRGADDG